MEVWRSCTVVRPVVMGRGGCSNLKLCMLTGGTISSFPFNTGRTSSSNSMCSAAPLRKFARRVIGCVSFHCFPVLDTAAKLRQGSRIRLPQPRILRKWDKGLQGGRQALGPFRLSKLGMAPLLAPFRPGWALWEVWEIEISMRQPEFEPFSWFQRPFFCL